jgi:transposase
MNEGGLRLNTRDERRIEVLNRVLAGWLTTRAAASLLGVSERQARRLVLAYRREGPRGVVHGNRGRRPARAIPDDVRARVVELAGGSYAGVNHSHLVELLEEREGIVIARSTLSSILREAGLRSPRPQRRRAKHRSRRERYPQEGMLLQIDASDHDWLQDRGPRLRLLAVIDDATGRVPAALLHPTEDTRGYFLLMRQLCSKTGIPQALYSDKHSIFWATNAPTLDDQLAGLPSTTQFGRAMAELGVQLIRAHSPQAKGRVERLWGTLQDRLVQELRLANVTTLEQANAFLPGFLRRFNRTFAVAPQEPGTAYRPRLTAAVLDHILCFKQDRVVSKDNTVRVGQAVLQILPGPNRAGYTRATVSIHETLDARWSVHYQGRQLPTHLIPLRKLLSPKPAPRTATLASNITPVTRRPPISTPAPDHPWRRYPAVTKSLSS